MNKYQPLTDFLATRGDARVPMEFAQIEAMLGAPLPASARSHRPWWANSGHGHSQARGWLDAGYRTEAVDLAAQRLVFVRLNDTAAEGTRSSQDHPLWGCMAGTLTIGEGVDLTQPMFADAELDDWDDHTERLIAGRL